MQLTAWQFFGVTCFGAIWILVPGLILYLHGRGMLRDTSSSQPLPWYNSFLIGTGLFLFVAAAGVFTFGLIALIVHLLLGPS